MTTRVSPIDQGYKSARFRWPLWGAAVAVLLIVHFALFGYVQNLVDMRPCIGYSPDPLMRLIPFDERWTIVTRPLYLWIGTIVGLFLITQAVKGRQFPLLRLTIASSITSSIRMATLYLIPLCRSTVAAGAPPPLRAVTTINLHLFSIPFRPFALNDLVFSGHVGIYLLILYATPHWPRPVRLAIGFFLLLMIYGLIATRDHYTVDILLAVPCSFFADRMAVTLVQEIAQTRSGRIVNSV